MNKEIRINNICITVESPEGEKETFLTNISFTREQWEKLDNGEEVEIDGWFYSVADKYDFETGSNMIREALEA